MFGQDIEDIRIKRSDPRDVSFSEYVKDMTAGEKAVAIKSDAPRWFRAARTKFNRVPFIHFLDNRCRTVEERFGSNIALFFRLLRQTMWLNMALFIVWLLLVITPWAQYYDDHPEEFHLKEQLNVARNIAGVKVPGNSTNTLFFYYSDYNPDLNRGRIGMSYTAAIVITFTGALVLLVFNITVQIMKSVRSSKARRVLTCLSWIFNWDFHIQAEETFRAYHASNNVRFDVLFNDLKAQIEEKDEGIFSKRNALRFIGTLLGLGVLLGSLYALFYTLKYQQDMNEQFLYLSTIVITGINVIVPKIMGNLIHIEQRKPDDRLNQVLWRTFFVKMVNVVFLVFQSDNRGATTDVTCVERDLGEMYIQLVVVNAALVVVASTFELIVYAIKRKKVAYDPSQDMIDVYYVQCILFIACCYAPTAFLYGFVASFIIFFVKYFLLHVTAKPPEETSDFQSNSLTSILILGCLFFAAIPTFFFLQKEMTRCGPHVGTTPLEALKSYLRDSPGTLEATYWIFHPMILFSIVIVLLITNFLATVVAARNHRQNVVQTRELEEEVKDLANKIALLEKTYGSSRELLASHGAMSGVYQ